MDLQGRCVCVGGETCVCMETYLRRLSLSPQREHNVYSEKTELKKIHIYPGNHHIISLMSKCGDLEQCCDQTRMLNLTTGTVCFLLCLLVITGCVYFSLGPTHLLNKEEFGHRVG